MDAVTENNGVIAGIVDLAQHILCKTLDFSDPTEAQKKKINHIQELTNQIRHEALELEKMNKPCNRNSKNSD